MLAATALLLLAAASANASWVQPEARFAEPSNSPRGRCNYECPAVGGYSTKEVSDPAASTTDCDYFGPPYATASACAYSSVDGQNEPTFSSGCPASLADGAVCPSSFTGTDRTTSQPGTYTLTGQEQMGLIFCYYNFLANDPTIAGTCTYANTDGASIAGEVSFNDGVCPDQATEVCLARKRSLTRLEKVIRARQYKPTKPAARS